MKRERRATNEQFFLKQYNTIKELFRKHNIGEVFIERENINYGLSLKTSFYKNIYYFENDLLVLCNKLEIVNTTIVMESTKNDRGKYRFEDYVLLVAAKHGDLDMVETTIANGADPKAVIEGETAYDWAKKNNHKNIIGYFDQLNTQKDTSMTDLVASDGNEDNRNISSVQNILENSKSNFNMDDAIRKRNLFQTIEDIKAKKAKLELVDSQGVYR